MVILRTKIKTFFLADCGWLFRYGLKRSRMFLGYSLSKIIARKFWVVSVEGTLVKLGFNNSYQHHIAEILAKKRHEFHLLEIWQRACKEKKIIVDIGGYNGVYGLLSAITNPEAKVYIFEPDNDCLKQIKDNIELNNLKNITIVSAAVSDKTGRAFFSSLGETGGRLLPLVSK